MRAHLTLKSGNKKTGPMPVSTTERKSCPKSCIWYDKGCYALAGPLKMHWVKVDAGHGDQWAKFCKKISGLPGGIVWRHNQAGDLPGHNERIDVKRLMRLVEANKGKRGFTYTHKDVLNNIENRKAVRKANKEGFTINLSADSLTEADKLAKLNAGPVVAIIPSDTTESKLQTPKGLDVIVCPAQNSDTITCASCKLCAVATRKSIIAFKAHGVATKTVDKIVKTG